MHWIVQDNMFDEEGMRELVHNLERMLIPFSVHKIVPFVGEIEPDINPDGPVIVIGAYSMLKLARRKGWTPGCFDNGNSNFTILREHWGDHLLNADAWVGRFDGVREIEHFFMRPVSDSKAFSGQVFEWQEYIDWRNRVVALEDDGSTLTPDTTVLVCEPKPIMREYRLWVVDNEIVTASLCKIGSQVRYDANVDQDVLDYARMVLDIWQPDRAFVLDVGMVDEHTYKVIEVNCLNAAGLYAANVGKLIAALEAMGYS